MIKFCEFTGDDSSDFDTRMSSFLDACCIIAIYMNSTVGDFAVISARNLCKSLNLSKDSIIQKYIKFKGKK